MRKRVYFVVIFVFFISDIRPQSEKRISDFNNFLNQLQENYLLRLSEKGVQVTNNQRALIFGYALKLQEGFLEEFNADKTRMDKLKEDVHDFFAVISDEELLWQICEETMKGQRDSQVLELMEGLPSYEPVFLSIGDALDKREKLDSDFSSFGDSQKVMSLVDSFCRLWKQEDYDSMKSMFGGRMAKEFSDSIEQMEADPELRANYSEFATNLEWRFKEGSVYAGEPEFLVLTYEIKELDDWNDYTFEFLKDGSDWKIIEFNKR